MDDREREDDIRDGWLADPNPAPQLSAWRSGLLDFVVRAYCRGFLPWPLYRRMIRWLRTKWA